MHREVSNPVIPLRVVLHPLPTCLTTRPGCPASPYTIALYHSTGYLLIVAYYSLLPTRCRSAGVPGNVSIGSRPTCRKNNRDNQRKEARNTHRAVAFIHQLLLRVSTGSLLLVGKRRCTEDTSSKAAVLIAQLPPTAAFEPGLDYNPWKLIWVGLALE